MILFLIPKIGEWNATWNGDIYNRHGHELQMMTAAISAVSLRGYDHQNLFSLKFLVPF